MLYSICSVEYLKLLGVLIVGAIVGFDKKKYTQREREIASKVNRTNLCLFVI